MSATARAHALEVRDLDVAYRVRGVDRQVLRSLSFTVEAGRSYGLVGESGCGKSTAALAAVRYLPRNGKVSAGSVSVAGADMLAMSGDDLHRTRAGAVSMVYQDPGKALNPSIRVGRQVAEVFEVGGASKDDSRERAQAMSGQGADRRPVQRYGALSPPAVGRHAAADRDRHGAGPQPGAADP